MNNRRVVFGELNGPCGHSWDGRLHTGCPRCAIAAGEAKLTEARQLIANADAANLAATERLGLPPFGCDTADHLADEIETLRRKVAEALKLLEPMDYDPDVRDAIAALRGTDDAKIASDKP